MTAIPTPSSSSVSGRAELLTAATADAIARIPVRFLRTGRHPSASVVAGATTFYDVYEAATAIDDVYRAIVDALVAAAAHHGVVLYAVPGSPLVAERTVELLLLRRPRPGLEALPAVPPPRPGVAGAGRRPAGRRRAPGRRALLRGRGGRRAGAAPRRPVRPARRRRTSSWPSTPVLRLPVVVLQRLGLPYETVVEVACAHLGPLLPRRLHPTSLWIPSLGAPVGLEVARFHELVRTLRQQCPWYWSTRRHPDPSP